MCYADTVAQADGGRERNYVVLRWDVGVDGWVMGLGVVLCGLLSLFAALEIALRVESRARMAERFGRAGRNDQFEMFEATRLRYLLTAVVIKTVLVVAMILMIVQLLGVRVSSLQAGPTIGGIALVVFLLLLFGVAIPNAWAKCAGESIIVRSLPLLGVLRFLCSPVLYCLLLVDPVVRRLVGVPPQDAKSYADELEQEILEVVSEGERHGAVDEEEREMIESVIELGDTRVNEVMTPRTEMIAVEHNLDRSAVLNTIRTHGHSRIPVYEETIDTILGVVYAKDLLLRDDHDPFQLGSVMRKVFFVPESKLVRDLLREFREKKVHIAVVLDEYGGTAGLVTIEDILEELVGEIRDEYDPVAPPEFEQIDDTTVEIDARMRVDELNDRLSVNLPEDEDYETMGGLVFSILGKIPTVGERCESSGLTLEVVGAEPRRVTRLRVIQAANDDDGQVAS